MEVCERLVMPGDDVTEDTEDKAGVVLGPGLRREAGDQVNCGGLDTGHVTTVLISDWSRCG